MFVKPILQPCHLESLLRLPSKDVTVFFNMLRTKQAQLRDIFQENEIVFFKDLKVVQDLIEDLLLFYHLLGLSLSFLQ